MDKQAEHIPTDFNSLLSSIIESPANIIIFALDRNYCYVAFNQNHKQTMKKIWGADIEIGMNMLEIIKDPKDRKTAKRNFNRALKGERFTLIEAYGEPPNRFYYENNYSPVYDESGQVTGLSLFLTDITERKKAEEELIKYRNQLENSVKKRTQDLEKANKELKQEIKQRERIEKQLRDSEERYRTLAESAQDSIFIIDRDDRIVFVNSFGASLLGQSPDDLIGKPRHTLFPTEVADKQYQSLQRVFNSGESLKIESQVLIRNQTVWLSTQLVPLKDESGNIHAVLGISRDATARKQAEEVLQKSSVELQSIFDAGPIPLIVVDADRKVHKANKATQSFAGQSEREMLGKRGGDVFRCIYALNSPEGCGFSPECEKCVVRNTVLDSFRKKQSAHNIETELTLLIGKEYSVRNIQFSTSYFEGLDGPRVVVALEDITDRKQVEKTLKESEEKYRGIFDESIEAIFLFDRHKKFIDVNQAGLNLLGYSKEELLTLSIPQVDANSESVTPVQKVLAGQKIVNFEHKLKRKDGRIITVLNNSRPITDAKGNVTGIQSTLIDITDRKEAAEELQKSKAYTENIIGSMTDALFVIAPDGTIETVNTAACDLLEYTHDEFMGMPIGNIFEENGEEDAAFRKQVLSMAEHKLQITHDRNPKDFWALLKSAPMAVITVNMNGKIIMINKKTASIFGYDEEELIGKKIHVLIPEEIRDAHEQKRKMYMTNAQPRFMGEGRILKALHKNGKTFEVEIGLIPLKINGDLHIVSIIRDTASRSRWEFIKLTPFGRLFGEEEKKEIFKNVDRVLVTKNRENIPVLMSGSVLRDDKEEIMGAVLVAKDITELKRFQEELVESRERYRSTIESMKDLIFTIDKHGRFIDYFQPQNSMLYAPMEAFLDKHFNDFLPSNIAQLLAEALDSLKSGESSIELTYPMTMAGREFWFNATLTARKDTTGKFNGATVVVRDITGPKRMEKVWVTLRHLSRRLNEPLRISEIGPVVAKEARHLFDYDAFSLDLVDEEAGLLVGIYNEDILEEGKQPVPVPTITHPLTEMKNQKALKGKSYILNRKRAPKKHSTMMFGSDRPSMSILYAPILLEERVIGVLSVQSYTKNKFGKEDLSLLETFANHVSGALARVQQQEVLEKALEAAKQGERVKSLFLANMSHEIRTPLNGILGFMDLIEDRTRDLVGEEEKEFFDLLRNSGERLMHTVHEILDISQIEAGTYKLHLEEVDLVQIIHSLVQEHRFKAEKKGLKLECTSSLDSAYILADRHGISQAIGNIIDNAIKYTDEGGVSLSLNLKSDRYILKVRDTGIGMSKEYMDRMFEAFSQESEGYTKTYQGIGLGMAIAKHHLDKNKAKIKVESAKGAGTVFTITFSPLKKHYQDNGITKKQLT